MISLAWAALAEKLAGIGLKQLGCGGPSVPSTHFGVAETSFQAPSRRPGRARPGPQILVESGGGGSDIRPVPEHVCLISVHVAGGGCVWPWAGRRKRIRKNALAGASWCRAC